MESATSTATRHAAFPPPDDRSRKCLAAFETNLLRRRTERERRVRRHERLLSASAKTTTTEEQILADDELDVGCAVATRAATEGSLWCAALVPPIPAEDGNETKRTTLERLAAKSLLDATSIEMDLEASTVESVLPVCRLAIASSSSSSRRNRSAGAGGAAAAAPPSSSSSRSYSSTSSSVRRPPTSSAPVVADVDGFFADYPECVRPPLAGDDDSDESSSSEDDNDDDEEEEEKTRRGKKKKRPVDGRGRRTTSGGSFDDGDEWTGGGGGGRAAGRSRRPSSSAGDDDFRRRRAGGGDDDSPLRGTNFDARRPLPQQQHRHPIGSSGHRAHPQQQRPQSHSGRPLSRQSTLERTSIGSNYSNGSYGGNVSNPYQQSRRHAAPAGSDAFPAGDAPHASASSSAWDALERDRAGARQACPFRTAGEYAAEESDDDDDDFDGHRDRNNMGSYGNAPGGGGGGDHRQRQYRNPYGGPRKVPPSPPRGIDPQRPPAARGGPSLSAGLKRKFQPPKAKKDSGGRGGGGNGGVGTATKPSSSKHDDGDDDDLPEELKGLDKELIEKIQNEIVDRGESVTFDDIAGLADAKQTVLELVCWPMKRPDLFTGLRRGPNGLLLFGPPGTGKTLVGKAIASESGATFFSISSSSLTSKWIGEGEKLVRTLFAVASYREPAVVFIDEVDSLLAARKADENEASRRIKTEFLVQLDGTGTGGRGRVLVIGATNRPHELDDAARRRFVKRLYIPLPARPDREALLRVMLDKNNHGLSGKELAKLATDTEGFSGADLKALCTDAALGPIRQLGAKALDVDPEDVPPISYKHFRRALRGMNASVAKADLDVYVEWNATYGSKSVSAVDDNDDDDEEEDDEDSEEESRGTHGT